MNYTEQCIRQSLQEVGILMDRAFDEVAGRPASGSALDQAGLQDGTAIVSDYLEHGEAGLALEHLIYMIIEADLPISQTIFHLIEQAGHEMRFAPTMIEQIRP